MFTMMWKQEGVLRRQTAEFTCKTNYEQPDICCKVSVENMYKLLKGIQSKHVNSVLDHGLR